MSTYELERRAAGDELVHLEVSGELDLTNAREFELRLEESAPVEARLVLDMSRVSFIDSAALHVLFRVARRRGPARLGIVVPPASPIARTLTIVGLERVATTGASFEALRAPGDGETGDRQESG